MLYEDYNFILQYDMCNKTVYLTENGIISFMIA